MDKKTIVKQLDASLRTLALLKCSVVQYLCDLPDLTAELNMKSVYRL